MHRHPPSRTHAYRDLSPSQHTVTHTRARTRTRTQAHTHTHTGTHTLTVSHTQCAFCAQWLGLRSQNGTTPAQLAAQAGLHDLNALAAQLAAAAEQPAAAFTPAHDGALPFVLEDQASEGAPDGSPTQNKEVELSPAAKNGGPQPPQPTQRTQVPERRKVWVGLASALLVLTASALCDVAAPGRAVVMGVGGVLVCLGIIWLLSMVMRGEGQAQAGQPPQQQGEHSKQD